MSLKTGLVFIICLLLRLAAAKEWNETVDCSSGTIYVQHIYAYKDHGNPDCGGIAPRVATIRQQCLCQSNCTFTLNLSDLCDDVNTTFTCDHDFCLDTSTTKTDVTTMTSTAPEATSSVGINASSTTVAGGNSTSAGTVVTSSISISTTSTEYESQHEPTRAISPELIAGVSLAAIAVVVGVGIVCPLVRRRCKRRNKKGSAFAMQPKQSAFAMQPKQSSTTDVPTRTTKKRPGRSNSYVNSISGAWPNQSIPGSRTGAGIGRLPDP